MDLNFESLVFFFFLNIGSNFSCFCGIMKFIIRVLLPFKKKKGVWLFVFHSKVSIHPAVIIITILYFLENALQKWFYFDLHLLIGKILWPNLPQVCSNLVLLQFVHTETYHTYCASMFSLLPGFNFSRLLFLFLTIHDIYWKAVAGSWPHYVCVSRCVALIFLCTVLHGQDNNLYSLCR